MNDKFYLISEEDVSPNKKDSSGNWKGDTETMYITTEPGETNMSHQIKTEGWLGTTNDFSRNAYGEFDTLEDARKKAHDLGFTHQQDLDDEDYCTDDESTTVEAWTRESASREQWDAYAWFSGLGREGTIDEYGITATTTDRELSDMVEKAEEDANSDGKELHDTERYFEELRDWLKEQEEESDDDDDYCPEIDMCKAAAK